VYSTGGLAHLCVTPTLAASPFVFFHGRVARPYVFALSLPKTKSGWPILAFFATVGRDAADTLFVSYAARIWGWPTFASPQLWLPHPSRLSKGEHYGRRHQPTFSPAVRTSGFRSPAQGHALRHCNGGSYSNPTVPVALYVMNELRDKNSQNTPATRATPPTLTSSRIAHPGGPGTPTTGIL
jgi:hypothetical protein